MAGQTPLRHTDFKQVAKDHHLRARERAMDPLDVFLISPHQDALNKTVGIAGNKVGTIVSHIVAAGNGRPKSSSEEAIQVFAAQVPANPVPCFSTATCDQSNSLPGGAPLIDHLAAFAEERTDWGKALNPMIKDVQSWRLPGKWTGREYTLGVTTDADWQEACDRLVSEIAGDREGGVYLQAADVECFGVDMDGDTSRCKTDSCLSKIREHRAAGLKTVKFNAVRRGKSGCSLPIRFFLGGSDWQIHIRLPVRYGVDGDPTKIALILTTKISKMVYQFFASLPNMVGFGITEDYVLWSKTTEAIWGEDFFTSVPPPIEIVDMMRLAGINMAQSSMFVANWWAVGSILPKDRGSLGDNTWGKPYDQIDDPLKMYLACDTVQPTTIAWLLSTIWTVHHFPDVCWVTEVSNLSAHELLAWVSDHVFKGLVAGWRKLNRTERGAWTWHDKIPNLQDPETIKSMPALLAKSGIPAGAKWDILRRDPGWPSVTAGGPKYIHSARVFMNELIPLLRALDENTWPLPHADQPILWQFGVSKEDVGPYPTEQLPVPLTVWEPNPGVTNPVPEEFPTLTRDLIRPHCSPVRGMRAVLLEFVRLFPYSGRDMVKYMEEHPAHFKQLVGIKRFRLVITELRAMLDRLGLEPVRSEGWVDPFKAHVRVEHIKKRAVEHLKRKIESMERADTQLSRNITLAKSALEDALDPELTDIGSHVSFRRWNEPKGVCRPPESSRVLKLAGATATPVSNPEPSGVEEVSEPPARKRKVGHQPVHFQEDLEIFINQSEMEEFGPA